MPAFARVQIKDTCRYPGETGKVVVASTFPASPTTIFYWVILPNINAAVGYWYKADCLTILSGKLPVVKKSTKRCKVVKGDRTAFFYIDADDISSLRAEGYIVTPAPEPTK